MDNQRHSMEESDKRKRKKYRQKEKKTKIVKTLSKCNSEAIHIASFSVQWDPISSLVRTKT